MPLTFATAGVSNEIKRIKGNDEAQRFLKKLGFVVGGTVSVVSDTGGNLIVNVKDSRIALSKSMACRIHI